MHIGHDLSTRRASTLSRRRGSYKIFINEDKFMKVVVFVKLKKRRYIYDIVFNARRSLDK